MSNRNRVCLKSMTSMGLCHFQTPGGCRFPMFIPVWMFGCFECTRRIMGVLLDIRLGTYVPWICQKSIENETNHKSHSVNGSNYIQSFSHIHILTPKFIWINNRIVGEAEGGPSTNHSHLPRASGQLPNISSPSFHLPFSSSLWLLSHVSFFFLLWLSAFLGWIRLSVSVEWHSRERTHFQPPWSLRTRIILSIFYFSLERTLCQTILVNSPWFWAFDDHRKRTCPIFFFFL